MSLGTHLKPPTPEFRGVELRDVDGRMHLVAWSDQGNKAVAIDDLNYVCVSSSEFRIQVWERPGGKS